MTRAIWTGNLNLSLINCTVKIHKANKDEGIHFKNIHTICHNPLNVKKWCSSCNREVNVDEIGKAFEFTKDKMIEISDSEIESVAVEGNKQIKIERVIDASEIPMNAFDEFYYLQPDKYGEHIYSLLARTLSIKNQVFIGRIVIRTKEHLVAIMFFNGGLMMITLHWNDELYNINPLIDEKIESIPDEELKLASMLLEKFHAPFEHESFKDSYRDKVKDMIVKKMQGIQIVASEVKPEVKFKSDIMEDLKRSIEILGTGKV